MNGKRIVLFALLVACGGSEAHRHEAEPESGELEEVALGTVEQPYVVQTTYGIRNDLAGGLESTRWRPCGPGNPAGQQCFYPAARDVGLTISTNGIPVDNDRQLFTFFAEFVGVPSANSGDNGFDYRFGCDDNPDNVCLRFSPEAPAFSVPSNVPDDHIRRYVQFVPDPNRLVDGVGGDRLFTVVDVLGDFLALKARTVGADGSCTVSNACGQGILHMIMNVLALGTGYGLLGTPSAQGRGVDIDIDGDMSDAENITGTPCQQLQSDAFNPDEPGVKNIFEPECFE